ncbi:MULTISPECIES: Fur family transcriptional regulator [unclassified Pedobacter]|uniref:Fur family transcriptional regulator n=1 Tax=unclassified Pedobacter TaxID=2628915 RepID=UPI000B4B14D1|nr:MULTISPECIES: transcriptional repressor [unclassified Pedobacter]MCX2430289.1 transcriptional repressor [Pedobacter sp. GR22-10]MCX2585749.1 transcriptional repressor [Pedobacter sp. MR22-3]OWK70265.1 Fur family transcriptional regulator [Pedobacter sp. AJM]
MNQKETQQYEDLLVKNGLKRTGARLQVLDILSHRDSATSQPYLENVVGKEIDRVTLYRILKTFEEKGIIHRVLDNQGTANYAICSNSCSEHDHHDEHVHFNCSKCLQVYCLDEVKIPSLKIEKGFKIEDMNLVVSGICKACNKAN